MAKQAPLDTELEKYIFDPENPRGFKVYDLLLRIIKERNNVAFFATDFLFEIFKAEIFDEGMRKKLWDLPQNYVELNLKEKKEIALNNISEEEFMTYVESRLTATFHKQMDSFFAYYLSVRISVNYTYSVINFNDWTNINQIAIAEMRSNGSRIFKSGEPETPSSKKLHGVIFLTENRNDYLSKFDFMQTSVLITTLDNFEAIKNEIDFPKGIFKPLLLRKIEDIHLLLNILRRDVALSSHQENKANLTTQALYLENLSIKNYFTIQEITLSNLSKYKEIYFLGENGVGKTLLLQAIVLALKGNENAGDVINFTKQNPFEKTLALKATDNQKGEYHYAKHADEQTTSFENVVAYGVQRMRFDRKEKEREGYLTLFTAAAQLDDPVEWLRYLDHKRSRKETTGVELETAKAFLKAIIPYPVEIEVTADEVYFIERESKLTFSQLSDGFKSVMIWLGDLIIRLSQKQPQVTRLEDFTGVVLIDEIDLLLHAKWQRNVMHQLRTWFPNLQFIITTHSDIVILGASRDAVFYKLYKENGFTQVSEPYLNENMADMMANVLLTSPLFELETARMSAFSKEKGEMKERVGQKNN
ncbi:MAG: AAA family ATPase [Bacteroidia bacterium]